MLGRTTLERIQGPCSRARAFTLLELVVVIVIIGIMAASAVPLFSGALGKKKAEGIMQELVLTLRLANQRAVFRQEKQEFVIDFRNHKYWFESLQPGKHSRRKRMKAVEIRPLPDRFEFLLVYFPGLDDTEKRRNARFSFYPDGTATEAVIIVGREDLTGEKDYDFLDVVKIRGTDARVTQIEGEDKQWYVDLL